MGQFGGHFDDFGTLERYGPTDGRTDPLIEIRGRILKALVTGSMSLLKNSQSTSAFLAYGCCEEFEGEREKLEALLSRRGC